MTPSAKDFITPLTLSTLSKNPVHSSFTNEEDENAVWNNHVELGLWADIFLIAPATANTMSKMATGVCRPVVTGLRRREPDRDLPVKAPWPYKS